jgi:hypothetical protein
MISCYYNNEREKREMSKLSDFKEAIKIDPLQLDKAVLIQADLVVEWSELWAEATRDRDRLKERINIVRAECDKDIRSNPKKFGWEDAKSPTEGFINANIPLHPKMKEVNEELIDLQYDVNIYSIAREALDHRKRAVTILMELYKSDYYSSNPRMTGYENSVSKENTKAQNEALSASPRLKKRVDKSV